MSDLIALLPRTIFVDTWSKSKVNFLSTLLLESKISMVTSELSFGIRNAYPLV